MKLYQKFTRENSFSELKIFFYFKKVLKVREIRGEYGYYDT